jgi:hypothetical protein
MNTLLWIIQGLLAVTFFYSGLMKSTRSEQWLVINGQTGVVGLPSISIKLIGISELMGVLGLILPWALNVGRVLTPISASGFALIMVLAAPIHYKLNEPKGVRINITLFLLSAFVAWGRFAAL